MPLEISLQGPNQSSIPNDVNLSVNLKLHQEYSAIFDGSLSVDFSQLLEFIREKDLPDKYAFVLLTDQAHLADEIDSGVKLRFKIDVLLECMLSEDSEKFHSFPLEWVCPPPPHCAALDLGEFISVENDLMQYACRKISEITRRLDTSRFKIFSQIVKHG